MGTKETSMIDGHSLAQVLAANNALYRDARENQKRNQLAQLNRAGNVLSSSLGLESTLKAILRLALEVTDAQYGIFRLLDDGGTELVTAAVEGLEEPLIQALPRDGKHVTGWVATHRQSLRIGDLRLEPWNEYYFPLDRDLEMRSELAVPLLGASGRLEGVLNLESPQVEAFDSDDQLLLETFAGQAVVAIQQARLMDALQEIAACVLEMPCIQVLQRLVEIAQHLTNANGVELETSSNMFKVGEAQGDIAQASLDGRGHIRVYLDHPHEWENKVVACLAHHAVLALKNEHRLDELKQSQQRQALTETFAAVGDLSANLLHQLNNKVGAIPVRIDGILDKSRAQVEESPYLAQNLQKIQDSAQSALQIVRKNLSILRPRASGMVSLKQCVDRAVKELEMDNVVCEDLDVPPVHGDFRSLTLVFLNLFENAVRAMDGAGQIRVIGASSQQSVVVKVADSGPGIPLEKQASVFELSKDRSRPHNLGFGLWWVRTVMERMDGSIELQSDGRSGTTFVLEFPR
jgi:nitrogen-specific signal transduction histidine kinase/putative methionine-R-sulfoxide reductase with GAF domain